VRVCTLGDLLLDIVVKLDEPLADGTDARAVTRTGAGGQAANVAAWAAELGAEACLIAKRGSDAAAPLLTQELTARGVELAGPSNDGKTGVVVSLVRSDGERAMATDRGVAPTLRPDELDPSWLDGADCLHLSGYSLFAEPIAGAAIAAAKAARERGVQVSVDLASWRKIQQVGPEVLRSRIDEITPALVFANDEERRALGRELDGPSWIVKKGAAGVEVGGRRHRAKQATVVDTTGAGDALAAGFLVGGVELGLDAAARCVAQLGAMP
jgi:ribokinase